MNNENKDTANLYIDMLKSHEKAIERVKGLVNDMSLEYVSKRINTKPIKGIVLKLLKEREKLYISIDDKYNISQEFADIIEKDLQNLRDRYTGVIKSLENIIRTRENHLHDEPQHSNESKSRKELPEELSTDVANKIFGTAISKGWIEVQNKQYKWVGFGKRPSIAQLAYLCGRVYGYVYKNSRNEGEHIPYNALEKLFNVERLDRSLAQVYEAVKPQSWRKEIDSLFD